MIWKLKVGGPRVHKQVFSDITADKEVSRYTWNAMTYGQALEIL